MPKFGWVTVPRVELHPELIKFVSGGSASCLTGGGSCDK
jgi:hypothetical protein